MRDEASSVLTVGELTRRIKSCLESEFGALWVEGEISNLRQPQSGHLYFTLKDATSQIPAVLFRGNQRGLTFVPQNGQRVRVYGDITVYEAQGQYQIIVRQVKPAGIGSLHEAFEKLKAKLEAEGLFARPRQPLPLLPRRIGIVTSPTGAAFRDILAVLERRNPRLHLVLAPVRVQGEGAAREIADAVDLLNRLGGFDVLIVGRGGGSLEDLWPFNEEVVARAIARSAIPVISAVGHEIDFTISDFVADVRAPTPSAAAEIVAGARGELEDALASLRKRLLLAARGRHWEWKHRLSELARSPALQEPRHLVRQYRQRVDARRSALLAALRGRLQGASQRLDGLESRLLPSLRGRVREMRLDLQRIGGRLHALNPRGVLRRGYSITIAPDGRALTSASGVAVGARLVTRLWRGDIESTVQRVNTDETEASHGGEGQGTLL